MSIGIGGIGGNNAMMQGMGGMKRPDPSQMADKLFSKLDTSGQGYIQKSDLQSAFDNISSSSSTVGSASNVDSMFSQLDTNSDGKVTKQEFTDTLKNLADQMDKQFMSMRMSGGIQGGGMGGLTNMGVVPSGGADGPTKDQLTSLMNEIGSSDAKAASSIKNIVNNFDKADTNGDGKVSLRESMAYDLTSSSTVTSTTASSTSTGTTSSSSNASEDAKLMLQIVKLMQAYGIGSDQNASDTLMSKLSVSA
jgi:Ca2+-binding EF-hand superfamily protein